MAYTAKSAKRLKEASGQVATGAKLKKAVFAYSLAWHPEQSPTKAEMLDAAKESLKAIGLEEHEAMVVEHLDEPHPHLHVVASKIHPLTGMVAKLKYTKRKLSEFAYQLERKEGKMYCPQRQENRSKRERGEKTKHVEPAVAEAWQLSNSGDEFISKLEDRGYQLAQGRKCIVIVDQKGKPSNAARALGLKAKEFRSRLGDETINSLIDFEKTKEKLDAIALRAKQHADTSEKTSDFGEQKSIALNTLELKQFDERAAISFLHDQRILRAEKELGVFYRLNEKRSEIEKLEKKQLISGFFQKFIGLHGRRERKLHNLKAGLANAEMRYDVAKSKLEHERAKALEGLKVVHLEQKLRLERNFDQWQPQARESHSNERQAAKQPRDRSHGLDLER
jgi:hypothetical protein